MIAASKARLRSGSDINKLALQAEGFAEMEANNSKIDRELFLLNSRIIAIKHHNYKKAYDKKQV